jgi:two-component system, NtrC family, response regulator AtoC
LFFWVGDRGRRVHDTHANLPMIVPTQFGTIDSAAATRMGAIDYVTKPFRIEELRVRLERASRAVELQQEEFAQPRTAH